jgi:hypothetical protein
VHVGQAEVAAGVVVGQTLVVEAQAVQDRGLQVVDVNGPLGHVEAQFVRGAEATPGFMPPPASHIEKACG